MHDLQTREPAAIKEASDTGPHWKHSLVVVSVRHCPKLFVVISTMFNAKSTYNAGLPKQAIHLRSF